MTLAGYDAFDDPYGYKGSDCLKNRLALRDPSVLQAFELGIRGDMITMPACIVFVSPGNARFAQR